MTPQEVLTKIKDAYNTAKIYGVVDKEGLEICRIQIKALEKQTPMQHHHTRVVEIHDEARISVCPSCLGSITTRKDEYPKFCTWCGQALDWSDTE